MTDVPTSGDGEDVLTLQQLIRARMAEQDWSYGDLERRSRGRLTKGRWQQLAAGPPHRSWPEPASMRVMAEVLGVEEMTIIHAAAQSLGFDARRQIPLLGQLLPAGTDLLSDRMRSAILAMVRAAVEDVVNQQSADGSDGDRPSRAGGRWIWSKTTAESPDGNAEAIGSDTDF